VVEVKQRGLTIAPEIAVGDGAHEVYPTTRHQRCWVHMTANVLNKVALSVQTNVKKDLGPTSDFRSCETTGFAGRMP